MSTDDVSRRTFMRTAGGAAAATGIAAGSAGTAAAQEAEPEWPSPVENANVGSYEDARGNDEVTISVGAGDGLAFDPTKVWVDAGTTIIWEWTGQGTHNVVTVEGEAQLESEITDEEGFTYEYETSEEDAGITHYQCDPHSEVGMHGGIAVGEDVPTADEGGSAAGVVFVPDGARALAIATFIAMCATLGLAFFFLSYGGDYGDE